MNSTLYPFPKTCVRIFKDVCHVIIVQDTVISTFHKRLSDLFATQFTRNFVVKTSKSDNDIIIKSVKVME